MKIIFFIFTFLVYLSSQAFLERKLGTSVMYNPVGAGFTLGMAYNQKWWDASKENNLFWLYGYVRPKAQLDLSGLLNGASVEMQIFPVSIFGVTFGSQWLERHIKKTAYFECDPINCEGQLKRDYWKANLAFSAGHFVSMLQYQRDHYQLQDDNQTYLEYSSLLLLDKENTDLEKKIAFVGYELSDKWTVGLLEFYQQMGPKKAEAQFIAGAYKEGNKKWFGGVGTSGSDYTEKYIAFFVKLNWILDPTLSLVD